MSVPRFLLLAVLVALVGTSTLVDAGTSANVFWGVPNSDCAGEWEVAAHWSDGVVPASDDNVTLASSCSVSISTDVVVGGIAVGRNAILTGGPGSSPTFTNTLTVAYLAGFAFTLNTIFISVTEQLQMPMRACYVAGEYSEACDSYMTLNTGSGIEVSPTGAMRVPVLPPLQQAGVDPNGATTASLTIQDGGSFRCQGTLDLNATYLSDVSISRVDWQLNGALLVSRAAVVSTGASVTVDLTHFALSTSAAAVTFLGLTPPCELTDSAALAAALTLNTDVNTYTLRGPVDAVTSTCGGGSGGSGSSSGGSSSGSSSSSSSGLASGVPSSTGLSPSSSTAAGRSDSSSVSLFESAMLQSVGFPR